MTWEADDQDKALAWVVEEADKCPSCGTHSYNQDEWEPASQTCRACMKLEMFKSHETDSPTPKKPGRSFVLRKVKPGREP